MKFRPRFLAVLAALVSLPGQTNVSTSRVNLSQRNNTQSGSYLASSGNLTVQTSAHGATAGFFWLINPVGSTKLCYVSFIQLITAPTAATTFTSSPRITIERTTFTGTASGATITPGLFDSTSVAGTCTVRTASTGLALSAGATFLAFVIPAVLTAVGQGYSIVQAFPALDTINGINGLNVVLRAGEGIIVRQPDAGSAADSRKVVINFAWDEAS